MSRRIMIINPWGVDYTDGVALDVVGPYLRDDTDVACVNLAGDAPAVPWPTPECLGPSVERARKAEADGFDAIVNACAGDPYLDELRAAVSIPVVGVAETILRNARSRGKLGIMDRRFPDDYLSLWPRSLNWDLWLAITVRYGLTSDNFSLRKVRLPTHPSLEDLRRMTRDDPDGLRDRMYEAFAEALHDDGLAQTKVAVEQDGVKAVFFACNFWSPSIAALGADAEKFGVPVINPLVSAATYAEHLLLCEASPNRRDDVGLHALTEAS